MVDKKALVIGASPNPIRYSHKAVKRLLDYNIPVVALGRRETIIDSVFVTKLKERFENIHTVALYLNQKNQEQYIEYIIELKPKRIIFNPGTYNAGLENKAKNFGIEVVCNCLLAMLNKNEY